MPALLLFWALLLLAAPAWADPAGAPFEQPEPPPSSEHSAGASWENLSGLERAEALLRFAASASGDARVPAAVEEAEAIFRELLGRAGPDPLAEGLTAFFSAPPGKGRLARLETVASSGDPRAVGPIAYVARRDAENALRLRAVDLLGIFPAAEAESALTALLHDSLEEVPFRARAIEALSRRGTPSAGETLLALAGDPGQPSSLRRAARDAVVAHFPGLAPRLQNVHVPVESSGRGLLTLGGAAFGSYSLGLVGSLSREDSAAMVIGGVGGLVIGGAAAYLVGSSRDIGQGEALHLLGAGLWSFPVGYFAGTLTGGPNLNCDRACRAIMLGTHLAALGGSWLARDHLRPSVSDNIEINGMTIASFMMMRGALDIPEPAGDKRPAAALLALAPAAGFIGSSFLAERMHLTAPVAVLSLFAAAEGAIVGTLLGDAWLPSFANRGPLGQPSVSDHRGVAIEGTRLLTAGLALGGVLASSAFWQPSASDVALISYSMLAGNVLGGGIPMLAAGHDGRKAGQIAAGLAGPAFAVAGGLLANRLDWKLDVGDMVFVGLGGAFALWQGAGWSAFAEGRGHVPDSWRLWGGPLTVTGLGLMGLMAGAQKLELSGWRVSWLYSGAAWGAWLGGFGSHVFGGDGYDTLAAALGGSAAGLAASALMLSPVFDVSPNTLAWASVFGVAGATVGSMVAVFGFGLDSPGRPIATANVIGSSLGLVGGALLAPRLSGVSERVAQAVERTIGDGLPLPTASTMPVLDPAGRMSGAGAMLTWTH